MKKLKYKKKIEDYYISIEIDGLESIDEALDFLEKIDSKQRITNE